MEDVLTLCGEGGKVIWKTIRYPTRREKFSGQGTGIACYVTFPGDTGTDAYLL